MPAEMDLQRNHPTDSDRPFSFQLSWGGSLKFVTDFTIALVLLVLTLPLIALAALLVKLCSPGPIIYSQTRLGRGGRHYRIFKIRTMIHNCEKHSGPRWSTPGDSRVTSIGRFLRRTHIDELPQLWNVLRGDMSLVGPRPERPEFAVHLDQVIPYYRKRLAIRPGVTGLAQVQLPGDTDLESVRRKLAYDLYYIQHFNLLLDMQIMLSTACKMLGATFQGLRKWFRLPTPERVEASYEQLILEGPRAPLGIPSSAAGREQLPIAADRV